MTITQHAYIRIKERCGLPKKAIKKNALCALQKGIGHSETTGRLKKYIDWLFLSHRNGSNIKLYNNYVYIFTASNVLITVLPLPNEYRSAVDKTKRRNNDHK